MEVLELGRPTCVIMAPGDKSLPKYNLAKDPGETKNLYNEHPDIVKRLKEKLEEFKKSGRSRPSAN